MHSFLVAEWKTIVGVILFCGALFCWFYHQEQLKEEAQMAPYEYTCLKAGSGFLNYSLGMHANEIASLDEFTKSENNTLNTVRYENKDKSIALNFKGDRLATIEYYPGDEPADQRCPADEAMMKSTGKQVSSAILTNTHHYIPYNGIVLVKKVQTADGDDQASPSLDDIPETTDIGWIITHNAIK